MRRSSFAPWISYGKKLITKIEACRHGGFFTPQEAKERGMRLCVGKAGEAVKGSAVSIYLFVDESDGVIADAKFQAFGPAVLLGAAEAACELLIRKNYDQARRLSADLIDKQVRDKPEVAAFPEEAFPLLNLILDAIEEAAEQCADISLAELPVPTPLHSEGQAGGHPGWSLLTKEEKMKLIEEVISTEIRPYIELDAGGIEVLDFVSDQDVLIAYQGACTSCYSAVGATLNAVQEILRSRLDPKLRVIPDASSLHLS